MKSKSTPGLVETSGKVPLEKMVLPWTTDKPSIELTRCSGSPSLCDNDLNNQEINESSKYSNSNIQFHNEQSYQSFYNSEKLKNQRFKNFEGNFNYENEEMKKLVKNNRSRTNRPSDVSSVRDYSINQIHTQ